LGRINITTLEIRLNESISEKHVASITELDDVCMNLKTHFVVYVDFGVLGARR